MATSDALFYFALLQRAVVTWVPRGYAKASTNLNAFVNGPPVARFGRAVGPFPCAAEGDRVIR